MPDKIGVIVVHGIGNPDPGETLHDLTDALSNWQRNNGDTVLQFEPVLEKRLPTQDPNAQKGWLPLFVPMFFRRCTMQNVKDPTKPVPMVFAEVFWGSASQLPAGILGVLFGFVNLFFHSIVITRMAEEGNQKEPRWAMLRRFYYQTARLTSRLLTGPIFALNILLLIACVTYLVVVKYLGRSIEGNLVTLVGVSGGISLLAAMSILWYARKRPDSEAKPIVEPSWWLVAFVPLWWLFNWIRGFSTIHEAGILLVNALLIFFVLVTVGLAFLIIARAIHLILGEHRQAMVKSYGPPLTISLFTLIVQAGLWVSVIPTLWTVLLKSAGDDTLNELYGQIMIADGLQWIVLLAVLICVLITNRALARQLSEINKNTDSASINKEQKLEKQRNYRLIVHPYLIVPLTVFVFITILLVWGVGYAKIYGAPLSLDDRSIANAALNLLNTFQVTRVIASIIVLLFSLIISPLWLALDLVNDIINYPYTKALDDDGNRGKSKRPPYRAIRQRFRRVLKNLVANESITQLVIVAHSLGSVIVLDELAGIAADMAEEMKALEGKIKLVTIGSPISHLFQHYFPGFYPGWENEEHWAHLSKRVGRWRHYYRTDDYIGTALHTPKIKDFDQCALGEGGHTLYWQDDRFVEKLYQELVS